MLNSMDKTSKIYVSGHCGLVGSAILRHLQKRGFTNIIFKTHQELDLVDSKAVADFFAKEKPEYVFLAAGRVGGIMANATYPANFIYENLMIQSNIIHQAHLHKAKKLLFLGSSCIYPRIVPQPIKESRLLTRPLEETNKPYAIAKIAGIIMCQSYNRQYGTNFISLMPTNLYGPHDNYHLENSHVVPALIRKFHEAKQNKEKETVLWGTGKPKREFLYVDDLADACVFLMNHYNDSEIINVGTGEDISIKKLAHIIKKIIGFRGKIVWDSSKPDGTLRKLLDVSRLHRLGWRHTVEPEDGLEKAYQWYIHNN